jgi:hypothetical protein
VAKPGGRSCQVLNAFSSMTKALPGAKEGRDGCDGIAIGPPSREQRTNASFLRSL